MTGDQFSIFAQEDKGVLWKVAFSDLEVAKFKARELAIQEGIEFFIFSRKDAIEVARFFPKPVLQAQFR